MHPEDTAVPTRRTVLKRLLATTSLFALFPARLARKSTRDTKFAERDSSPLMPPTQMNDLPALGNRAHFTAKPAFKERLIWCFSTVLRCGPAMTFATPGIPEPIVAFRFPGGGSISIEFNDKALNEDDARRGAWLEIQTDDPDALTKRILESGLEKVEYSATTTFYFAAPGGQVFGVIDRRRMQPETRKP